MSTDDEIRRGAQSWSAGATPAWTDQPGGWVSTGHREQVAVNPKAMPEIPPFTGEHLWVVIPMYRVDPTSTERPILDHENLMTIQGPGCYWCEEDYEKRLTYRRCKGDGTVG